MTVLEEALKTMSLLRKQLIELLHGMPYDLSDTLTNIENFIKSIPVEEGDKNDNKTDKS